MARRVVIYVQMFSTGGKRVGFPRLAERCDRLRGSRKREPVSRALTRNGNTSCMDLAGDADPKLWTERLGHEGFESAFCRQSFQRRMYCGACTSHQHFQCVERSQGTCLSSRLVRSSATQLSADTSRQRSGIKHRSSLRINCVCDVSQLTCRPW